MPKPEFVSRPASPTLPRKMKGLADEDQALHFVGGANRDRTGDLYNAIVALSQLSYGPKPRARRDEPEIRPAN
jgi:hypothetical protein